jgi:hypothetical protein
MPNYQIPYNLPDSTREYVLPEAITIINVAQVLPPISQIIQLPENLIVQLPPGNIFNYIQNLNTNIERN